MTTHTHGHGHGHGHGHLSPTSLIRQAISATLHCLMGCAIGEILGMVLATELGWGNGASVAVSVVLAFTFGYALTLAPVVRSGLTLRRAIPITVAADTVSIAVMEAVDNGFIVAYPGAMDANLGDSLFWASLVVSLVIAFTVTVPVNRALIRRGRGHAAVHQFHH